MYPFLLLELRLEEKTVHGTTVACLACLTVCLAQVSCYEIKDSIKLKISIHIHNYTLVNFKHDGYFYAVNWREKNLCRVTVNYEEDCCTCTRSFLN